LKDPTRFLPFFSYGSRKCRSFAADVGPELTQRERIMSVLRRLGFVAILVAGFVVSGTAAACDGMGGKAYGGMPMAGPKYTGPGFYGNKVFGSPYRKAMQGYYNADKFGGAGKASGMKR